MRKRILSAVLAGTLAATVLAGSVISAGAIKKDDDSYDPGSVEANTYLFAMVGKATTGSRMRTERVSTGGQVPTYRRTTSLTSGPAMLLTE